MSQISAHQDFQTVLDWIPIEPVGQQLPMTIASDKLCRDSAAHCTCGPAYRRLAPSSFTFNAMESMDLDLPQSHCIGGTLTTNISAASVEKG